MTPAHDIARIEENLKSIIALVQDSRESHAGFTVSLRNITEEQRKISENVLGMQKVLGEHTLKTALLESDVRAVQDDIEGIGNRIDREAKYVEEKLTTVEQDLRGLLVKAGWAAGALAVLGVLARFGPSIVNVLA